MRKVVRKRVTNTQLSASQIGVLRYPIDNKALMLIWPGLKRATSQLPIERGQTRQVFCLRQQFGLE